MIRGEGRRQEEDETKREEFDGRCNIAQGKKFQKEENKKGNYGQVYNSMQEEVEISEDEEEEEMSERTQEKSNEINLSELFERECRERAECLEFAPDRRGVSNGCDLVSNGDTVDNANSPTGNLVQPQHFEIDYVEPALNFQGNYHNYVSMVLKSLIPLRFNNLINILNENKIILPDSELNKKTLILDLDETLIHSDFDRHYDNPDHVLSFTYGDQEVKIPLFLRPGLFQFLENIAQLFEVFIFTASKREYADAVLDFLDPYNRIFKRRFYREHCINVADRIFVKDLRVFVNRKPENLIIVDNSLYSFSNQLSNGILINSFYNDKEDRELFNLFNYLQQYIRPAADPRDVNEKIFNFGLIFEEYAHMERNQS